MGPLRWNLSRLVGKTLETDQELTKEIANLAKVGRVQRKRTVRKTRQSVSMVKTPDELNDHQKAMYEKLCDVLKAQPGLQERLKIYENLRTQSISARDINHFVVQFAREESLCYHVDITEFPHKLVGKPGDPDDPEAKALSEQGRNIVFVHLYGAYANSTTWNGNLFYPFKRDVRVKRENGEVWPISWMNFYIWFDAVCGLELFTMFRKETSQSKKAFEAASALRSLQRKKNGKHTVKRATRQRRDFPMLHGFTLTKISQSSQAILGHQMGSYSV